MHARLAIALLALLAAPALGSVPGPAAASRVQEFGCTQNIGFFLLPIEGLQARLPPGFQAAAADPIGAAGAVFVASLDCPRTVVDGVEAGPALETGTGIVVAPPAGWAVQDVGTYVVATFANTAPRVASAFAGWDIGGTGTLDVQHVEGDAATLSLARGSYAGLTFTMATAAGGDATTEPASKIRAFGVRDGRIAHVVDLTNEASAARGGLPGGARPPGGAAFAFDPSPYELPAAAGFAQHAQWSGLALQWDLVHAP